MRVGRRIALLLASSCVLVGASLATDIAAGQPPPMEVPWVDVPAARDGAVIRSAAVGVADARIGRFSARRASARTEARRRALEALHAWADDALAAARADPREATAVHAAIERDAAVAGVRPLVDGGAVVVVEVGVEGLRRACALEGLPWLD